MDPPRSEARRGVEKSEAGSYANIAQRAILAHSIGLPIECDLTKSTRFGEYKSVAEGTR